MKKTTILLTTLLALLLAACGAQVTEEPGGNPLGGAVYISNYELLIMESYPVQVALWVEGDLPTPCHEFRYQYEIQNFGGTVRLDVVTYSYADPATACAQVLQPFEHRISFDLTTGPDGDYELYLDGELVGEFTYPG
jgi:hypothetical protein